MQDQKKTGCLSDQFSLIVLFNLFYFCCALSLTLVLPIQSALADDSSSGCGLGWMVLKKNSLVSSFSRTLVNATFSNTLAMTSGTSGCAQHSLVKKEFEVQHYVQVNFDQLSIELAKGEGEYVEGLANVLGCQNAQSLGQSLQQKYQKLFSVQNSDGMKLSKDIMLHIQQDRHLSAQCFGVSA